MQLFLYYLYDQVGFNVYMVTDLCIVQVGFVQCLRYHGHFESAFVHICYGQRNPIDRDGTFGHHLSEQLGICCKAECPELTLAVDFFDSGHTIDVALHEMPSKPPVGFYSPFYIDDCLRG